MAPFSRRTKALTILTALGMAAGVMYVGLSSRPTLARLCRATCVGFFHTTPPPWPDGGNCFWVVSRLPWYEERYLSWLPGQRRSFEGWHVINMHAENFEALCQQRGSRWVQVERVGDQHCLVVDPRIPPEWLLHAPCTGCVPIQMRKTLRVERPECFRKEPLAETLMNTSWILVERVDPAARLERLLPGERLGFGVVDVSCATTRGDIFATRYWELRVQGERPSLSVYEVHPGGFSALSLGVECSGTTLTLRPNTIIESDASGTRFEGYDAKGPASSVRYRLASADRVRTNDTQVSVPLQSGAASPE